MAKDGPLARLRLSALMEWTASWRWGSSERGASSDPSFQHSWETGRSPKSLQRRSLLRIWDIVSFSSIAWSLTLIVKVVVELMSAEDMHSAISKLRAKVYGTISSTIVYPIITEYYQMQLLVIDCFSWDVTRRSNDDLHWLANFDL